MRIGIDPGHGGSDPGAVGPSGLQEADVNLDVGLRINQILEVNGLEVITTRTGDRYINLFERTKILNHAKCDYVISIHCNSSTFPEPDYVSTFIQGRGGEAEKLAKGIQRHLVDATGWADGGVRVKNLHMTRETDSPAILVEMGFISNPDQEARLKQEGMRKALALSIALGILDYLKIKPLEVDSSLPLATIKAEGRLIGGVNIRGRIYAPVRALAEALGRGVEWDDATKTVTVMNAQGR